MALTGEKWVVMALLAVISIILGFFPYLVIRWTKTSRNIRTDSTAYKIGLTVLSCFGAGVLLSTALVHLLPEVREKFAEIPSVWETFDAHFPVAEMVLLCGFLMIYLVEEVAHFIMVDGHHDHHHHNPNSIARHNSIAHGIHLPESGGGIGVGNTACNLANNTPHSLAITHDEGKICSLTLDGKSSGAEEECPDEKNNLASSIRALLTLVALSFHELMEGIAIGIQDQSSMWVMFGAIASHKFVISFCMGMELVNSQAGRWTFIGSILFFGVVSSLGIGIGGVITSDTNTVPVAVIEGLVCGTLLYVVSFEILNRERERKTYSMKKSKAIGFIQFVALGLGMVAMTCLSTFSHDHGHSEDEHDHDHDH